MSVLLIRKKATKQEIDDMLKTLETYVKIAVDIQKGILAGGGVMHADCEATLLENGSEQKNIWGANWDLKTKTVEFEALINIRPRDKNLNMQIQDPKTRYQVERVVRDLLEIS